jgi:ABC-type phosphate transport system substrate-binding protein
MSAHAARPGSRPRRSPHLAIWAAAALALLTAACTSTSSLDTTASVVAAASPRWRRAHPHRAGSTFDAPFFCVAFARYQQQQHPDVSIGYSAVGSRPAACYPVTKVRK